MNNFFIQTLCFILSLYIYFYIIKIKLPIFRLLICSILLSLLLILYNNYLKTPNENLYNINKNLLYAYILSIIFIPIYIYLLKIPFNIFNICYLLFIFLLFTLCLTK